MDREQLLLEYIKEDLLHGRSPNLTSQDNLLDSGTIDSLGILQIVAYIEERMVTEILPEDVVYENFYSIDALVKFLNGIQEKRS